MAEYYISANGSDSNAGTLAAPWLTVGKLNTEVNAGNVLRSDTVFLRRGDVFYGRVDLSNLSATGTGLLKLRPYGYGPLPQINGYKVSSDAWTLHAAGIWKLDITSSSTQYSGNKSSAVDVGHLRQGSSFKAYKRNSLEGLINEWDFFSDETYVYVNKATSPGAGIRIAVRQSGLTCGNNIDVRGVHVLGHGAHGMINSGKGAIVVSRNVIEDIGGSYISGSETRYGNGFEGYTNARSMNVTQNLIRQCFDVGMTVQGPMESNSASNILYQGNWIENCNQSFEVWATTSSTPSALPLAKIFFTENVCVGAGRSWAAAARADSYGKGIHLLSYQLPAAIEVFVRRNVFFDAKDALAWYHTDFPAIPRGYVVEDNSVYLNSGTKISWQDAQTVENPGANKYVANGRLFRIPTGTTLADVLGQTAAQAAFAVEAARYWSTSSEIAA